MQPLQHIGVWTLVLGVHAWGLAWWAQHQPQVLPKSEVTWIQWAADVPAPRPAVKPLAPKAVVVRSAEAPIPSQPVAQTQAQRVATISPLASATVALSVTSASTLAPASTPAPDARGEQEVTLPSQNAAYLNNPKPAYPPISMRMGEQGRVVVRVLIDDKGLPQQAQLETSSGYARLDQAALKAVMTWRFVPGRKGGQPQTMWFSVPITFDLKPAQDG